MKMLCAPTQSVSSSPPRKLEITGLLPQTAGSVHFDGTELPPALADRSKDQKRRIQMIYQMADTAMNPRQTVRDIIGRPLEFYLDLRGKAKNDRITELLEMIELDGRFLERLPSELSTSIGRSQQRPKAPYSNDLSNGGHGDEPASNSARYYRQAAGILS
jgi:ABC-type antimicrobial peptide transport system ATPase subunit